MAGTLAPAPARCSTEEIRLQLRRILTSHAFAESERLRSLLTWLIEQLAAGRTSGLKEAVIGIEVFHRPPSWDHQSDSIVRVQVHNLRLHLARYYATEGHADPLVIEIPKGSYLPRVAPLNARPHRRRRYAVIVLAAAAIVSIAACLYLLGSIASPPPRVAVLEFQNLSGDTSQDYVTRGLTEELAAFLARSQGLQVVTGGPLKDYGEEFRRASTALNARYILTGSIRPAGNPAQWSVTSRLIDAKTGVHLWSNHYERTLPALESLPIEIAAAVLKTLRVPETRPRLSS